MTSIPWSGVCFCIGKFSLPCIEAAFASVEADLALSSSRYDCMDNLRAFRNSLASAGSKSPLMRLSSGSVSADELDSDGGPLERFFEAVSSDVDFDGRSPSSGLGSKSLTETCLAYTLYQSAKSSIFSCGRKGRSAMWYTVAPQH